MRVVFLGVFYRALRVFQIFLTGLQIRLWLIGFSSALRCSFHLLFLLPFHFFPPYFQLVPQGFAICLFSPSRLKGPTFYSIFRPLFFLCRTPVKQPSINNYQNKTKKTHLWHTWPYVNTSSFSFLLKLMLVGPTECMEEDKNNVGQKKTPGLGDQGKVAEIFMTSQRADVQNHAA